MNRLRRAVVDVLITVWASGDVSRGARVSGEDGEGKWAGLLEIFAGGTSGERSWLLDRGNWLWDDFGAVNESCNILTGDSKLRHSVLEVSLHQRLVVFRSRSGK